MENAVALNKAVLHRFGAHPAEEDQLLEYISNPLTASALPTPIQLPLPDEPFAEAWGEYAAQAASQGCLATLRQRLIQLNFPIQAGISATKDYQDAVKKGKFPDHTASQTGTTFVAPEQLRLDLHPSPAGAIGVITAGHRQDFVALVQALTAKNEPEPVPDSLGAFMISGYNNWDRVHRYRQQWEQSRNGATDEFAWLLEFPNLKQHKERYQDRFILLSSGPYSGLEAQHLGLSARQCNEQSRLIRLNHECTHYFTRRVFGSMRRNIWDEILADYMGISAARGAFSADWFLHFLGLEDHPRYRPGKRFEKYLPETFSDKARTVVQAMTCVAAEHVQDLDQRFGPDHSNVHERSVMLLALCLTGWSGLVATDYQERFHHAYQTVCSRLPEADPKYIR